MAARRAGNNRETVSMEPQNPKKKPGKTSQANSAASKDTKSPKTAKNSKNTAKKKSSKASAPSIGGGGKRRMPNEITAIIMLAIGAFFLLSFQTGLCGTVGKLTGTFFKGLLGAGAYFIPYLMIIYAILMLIRKAPEWRGITILWMTFFILGVDLLNSCRFTKAMEHGLKGIKATYFQGAKLRSGGLFGMYAGGGLYKAGGLAVLYIAAIVLLLVGAIMLFKYTFFAFRGGSEAQPGKERRESKDRNDEPERRSREKVAVTREPKRSDAMPKSRDRAEPLGGQMEIDYPRENNFYDRMNEERRRESFLEKIGIKSSDQPSQRGTAPPKWPRKMPDNQKGILDLVWNENEFGKDVQREGYGLDGSQQSLHQRPDFNRKQDINDIYGSDMVADNAGNRADNGNASYDRYDPSSQEGSTKSEPEINEKATEEKKADSKFAIGGESVATAKSSTENSDSDVAVTPTRSGRYKLPPIDLLKAPSVDNLAGKPEENLNEKAELLEQTLRSFNVEAKVINVISGPSVTRYEIQPAVGVKVQKITSLSDDIALNMRANSIRIEAPIPGKAAVGIEIENTNRQAVTLREIIASSTFRGNKSKLAFSVGRDIGGNAVVADLGKMPHLLIAGATGSGKSVCINTIIASMLYKARPEEVKMILIDPKMVELGNYNGIPHLLIPVVTDASKAASALNWAVAEMTERYKKFAANNVRDIGSFNSLKKEQGEKDEILPQIVIIIDELSDLMMVASSQVEDAICRLAQLARAAGMHLIVATQRPSVDVITGLIKANIPSRIAFMVSSQIDSRTIIDMPGAEKLVGNGDMLFKPQDLNKPKRIQGPFVSDAEIRDLISYVKSQAGDADYDQAVIEQIDKGKDFSGSDDGDELLADAVAVVINAGQASVSMLQRRFRIGYNRAARIVDIMEQRGIVGPPDGARPRQVLISEAEFNNMKEAGEI